jgi:ribonucleoside-diphosphate reductase alpha chain
MDNYQTYIFLSRYARWIEEEGRRETWPETVKRYCDFFYNRFGDKYPYELIYNAILNLEVMPSMRCMMTAGPALERDEVAGYNCSYLPIDNIKAFDETLYILMCGVGVGFSVERQYINKLPNVAEEFYDSDTTIVFKDSRIGWATGLREFLSLLYQGKVPKWDLSKLRSAGARLKTFGGRSSGPEPLNDLLTLAVGLFKKAKGRKLSSLECHDLICKIADCVVVGGVRRSALISLSNLTDERMRNAKTGAWWEDNPQRALANNSVAYTELPDIGIFLKEWTSLYESKSGERGIFNRVACTRTAKSSGRRIFEGHDYGTNPCGEIILRNNGLCNLSEVVVRSKDDLETLRRKVEIATIIGTFQSTLTNFRYIRNIWKHNAEEERLLGVSLTGIMDHPSLGNQPLWLQELKNHAIQTNNDWSQRLGINQSAAITTVKPSGTVSQLVNSASGIHPRYSKYYIRSVRSDKTDPLAQFLVSQGVPYEDDITKPNNTYVFYFPVESPDSSVFRDEITALEQLEHYLVYKENWCEHNVSCTIYVRESEWFEIGAWVYKHFNELGGVSFLPHTDHIYKQAPYQEITKEKYETLVNSFPKIKWDNFHEEYDGTTGTQELACSAGICEIL